MRRPICLASLAALTIAFLPFASSAQSQPGDDVIVVTGELQEQAKRKAQAYVNELGVATGERPTARWFDPICPHAIGLSKQHAAIVEQQIRRIIREVGAPLAKAGCRSNLVVAFTDGPEHVVKRIARAGSELPSATARELKQGDAAVRWWYDTEFRTRDGLPAGDTPPPSAFVEASNATALPSGQSGNLSLYNSSLVSTQVVRAIHSATVIVDVQRTQGVPLKSVVDYAALVGLAEIVLGASPDDSILSLLQTSGERGLTHRDRAFLTSLYRIAMDRKAGQQRRAIVQAMVKPKAWN
jgi:hypothetical protein